MAAEELAVETQAVKLAVMQEIMMLAEELAVEMQAERLAVMQEIPMVTKAWSAIAYKSKKCPQKKKRNTA